MVLDVCPNSCSSMLPSSWMMRLDSSLKIMEFSGCLRSSRIAFVYEPFLNFPTSSGIWSIRSSSFKDYNVSNSFNSEVGFKFRLFFNRKIFLAVLFPAAGCFRILCRVACILFWLFLNQIPRRLFPAADRCTFRCAFPLLLLLRPRCRESLE